MEVREVSRLRGGGTDYYITNAPKLWNWKEMIAQLDHPSMEYVVLGPERGSGGVRYCYCAPTPGSYDHARAAMFRAMKAERFRQCWPHLTSCRDLPQLPDWDFVIVREDWTEVRLHPTYSTTKFKAREQPPSYQDAPIPKAGLGRSDGKGTFKKHTTHPNQVDLKFDGDKSATGNKEHRKHAV